MACSLEGHTRIFHEASNSVTDLSCQVTPIDYPRLSSKAESVGEVGSGFALEINRSDEH